MEVKYDCDVVGSGVGGGVAADFSAKSSADELTVTPLSCRTTKAHAEV